MVFRDSQNEFNVDDISTSSGRGMRGPGMVVGGGGALVVVLVCAFLGVDPSAILEGADTGTQSQISAQNYDQDSQLNAQVQRCVRSNHIDAQAANTSDVCRSVATFASAEANWRSLLGQVYRNPKMRLFEEGVYTGCGPATSDVGPFYCPTDRTIYLDVSFFHTMLKRIGGSTGPLAEEYVVAHEFGHHVQTLLGQHVRSHSRQGAHSDSVRLELQADCYAGVWAQHASHGPDATLEPITEQQINEVIQTAEAIGDDTLQKHSGRGGVDPDGWTHGSSQERVHWFLTGYRSGSQWHKSCDTFSTNDLEAHN